MFRSQEQNVTLIIMHRFFIAQKVSVGKRPHDARSGLLYNQNTGSDAGVKAPANPFPSYFLSPIPNKSEASRLPSQWRRYGFKCKCDQIRRGRTTSEHALPPFQEEPVSCLGHFGSWAASPGVIIMQTVSFTFTTLRRSPAWSPDPHLIQLLAFGTSAR